LEELDLQFNEIETLELGGVECFPNMHTLHLAYNKVPPGHLTQLASLPNLQVLNLAQNSLCTLPSDLTFLPTLLSLNLSANNFASESTLVDPASLFSSLASLPQLRKLNLSQNKFTMFHTDQLHPRSFPYLEELNFAFNLVVDERALLFPV
jgi:Leucine-rich repeat (LRR) protein